MIRRWVERWVGHDRLLVAYEKTKRDNEDLSRELNGLRERHLNLRLTYDATVARSKERQTQIRGLTNAHVRALTDLAWERYLNEVNDLGTDHCVKIRLMDHDSAWDVADFLTERFGKRMYAYFCTRCPQNPITRDYWWHTTRKWNRRNRPK